MNQRKLIGAGTALLLGLALTAGLAGCATSGISISRVKLYNSVSELAQDSDVIVVGTAHDNWVTADLPVNPDLDFTLSDFVVEQVVRSDIPITVNDTIVVRQVGAENGSHIQVGNKKPVTAALVPILQTGQRYLLYLNHSGLDGDLASQYYITGVSAGMYVGVSAKDPTHFKHITPDEGDVLPASLHIDQALG